MFLRAGLLASSCISIRKHVAMQHKRIHDCRYPCGVLLPRQLSEPLNVSRPITSGLYDLQVRIRTVGRQ